MLEVGWADLAGLTDLNLLRVGVGNHIQQASHALLSTSATLARGSMRTSTGAVHYQTAQMSARTIPASDCVLGPLVDEWS